MVVKSSFVSFIALALGSLYANAGQYEFYSRGNPQPSGEQTFTPAPDADNDQYSYTPPAGYGHQYEFHPRGNLQPSGEQTFAPAPGADNYQYSYTPPAGYGHQYEFHPRGNPQPSGEQTFVPAPGADNYQSQPPVQNTWERSEP